MLNVKELKAEMVRSGYTQQTLAAELGITARTFATRLKTGDFTREEIETMICKLQIADVMLIFFSK